jgi:hypothetical protein
MVRFTPALVLMLSVAGLMPAAAQSYCDRLRTEISQPGGDSETQGFQSALGTARAELGQILGQARQVGCEPSRFLFFSTTPSQCKNYETRIDSLKERVRVLEQRVAQGGARRNQLIAAYQANCQGGPTPPGNVGPVQARSRNVLDMLFGGSPDAPASDVNPDGLAQDGVIVEPGNAGPRRLICVRKCDGYFFPLAGASGGSGNDAELCRAQCPNTEVEVFVSPAYGDVKFAVSLSGTPYPALPNAFKYRTSYDPACSCRKQGQSWSEALVDAERMIGGRRGETIITEEKSLELSRPTQTQPNPSAASRRQQQQPQAKPNNSTSGQQVQTPAQTSPAQAQPGQRPVLRQDQGEWIEIQNADGTTRKVRVVAPQGGPAPARP